jgi:hypothetical protein
MSPKISAQRLVGEQGVERDRIGAIRASVWDNWDSGMRDQPSGLGCEVRNCAI